MIRHWHRLHGESVYAPSLEVMEDTLRGALSSLIWWVANMSTGEGLELDDLKIT